MRFTFDDLCEVFEDKVARQERLLDACRAQQRAIRAHDFEYVGAKALDFRQLLDKHAEAEEDARVDAFYDFYRVPKESRNVAALAGLVPQPYGARLLWCDAKLRELSAAILHAAHDSVVSMQRMAETIDQCMRSFRDCVTAEIEVSERTMPIPEHAILAQRQS